MAIRNMEQVDSRDSAALPDTTPHCELANGAAVGQPALRRIVTYECIVNLLSLSHDVY